MDLQKDLGHDNVVLNLELRKLTIRGNDAAQNAVHGMQKYHNDGRRDGLIQRPVRLNQVILPIQLQCGNSWCKECFANYLVAATDNRIFPLMCLGSEATSPSLSSLPQMTLTA